jgi:hypothetical protein
MFKILIQRSYQHLRDLIELNFYILKTEIFDGKMVEIKAHEKVFETSV